MIFSKYQGNIFNINTPLQELKEAYKSYNYDNETNGAIEKKFQRAQID